MSDTQSELALAYNFGADGLLRRGRKDFTALINNARNLSRLIWVVVNLPPTTDSPPPLTRIQLTLEKKRLIRLVVAFVVATKHHLRAEGGVHHEDLKGRLTIFPTRDLHLKRRPSSSPSCRIQPKTSPQILLD